MRQYGLSLSALSKKHKLSALSRLIHPVRETKTAKKFFDSWPPGQRASRLKCIEMVVEEDSDNVLVMVNHEYAPRCSPLRLALAMNDVPVVDYLLKMGARVTSSDIVFTLRQRYSTRCDSMKPRLTRYSQATVADIVVVAAWRQGWR